MSFEIRSIINQNKINSTIHFYLLKTIMWKLLYFLYINKKQLKYTWLNLTMQARECKRNTELLIYFHRPM